MLIALTGGIGAGKSTVSRQLSAHGATIIDADRIARDIVDPEDASSGPLLAELRALLGNSVFNTDGSLNRRTVASVVFNNDNADLLAAYNKILRPALIAATTRAITSASAGSLEIIIVHEIPLLNSTSADLPWAYDLVLTVEAPIAERIRRLVADRGYSDAEANARVLAQGSEKSRADIADLVLRNDGSPEKLQAQVNELWVAWTHPDGSTTRTSSHD